MNDLKVRSTVFLGIITAVFCIYVVRLFFLQVISSDFSATASKNLIKKIVLQPARGIMYDRKNNIYVTNTPIFDLMVVPEELKFPDSATFGDVFESTLQIPRENIWKNIEAARKYNRKKPSLLEKQIDAFRFTTLQEKLWEFEGINTIVRNTREYKYPAGGNFLGYISEVSKSDIEKNEYYSQGDLIGKIGIERNYEDLLGGRKGIKSVMVDVHGREVGIFDDGRHDERPIKGKDIQISIDAELQAFAEQLMVNKIGSIVAIEPSSGEVLAFVSAPSYDPNLLSGGILPLNYKKLKQDSTLPLFNRPLMAMYPPGSVFKLLNALVALEEGIITPGTTYGCAMGFLRNGGRPACHSHPSPTNVSGAIQYSCNAYFASIYIEMLNHSKYKDVYEGYETWRRYMTLFGAGRKIGIDIPNEKPGMLPRRAYYDKIYGANRWKAMTTVSNSIGQGEVLMTPLQMASAVASIANRGYYVQPHFLKRIYEGSRDDREKFMNFDTVRIPIRREYFEIVVDAMEQVVLAGTARSAWLPDISVCGKTGTAQNPHGEDHSVFIAFAPKDNPKIAIAVIVENSGFGGTWAAPISSLVIEKYLKREIADQAKLQRILDADFIRKLNVSKPKKTPVKAPKPAPVETVKAEGNGA
jgi:penicillin-binding protein 2